MKDLLCEIETIKEGKGQVMRLWKISAGGKHSKRIRGKAMRKEENFGPGCFCVMSESLGIFNPNKDELLLARLE